MSNIHFYSPEIVGRGIERRFKVGENVNFAPQWFYTHISPDLPTDAISEYCELSMNKSTAIC